MSREALTATLCWVVPGAGLQERGSPEAGVGASQSRGGGESARAHVSRSPQPSPGVTELRQARAMVAWGSYKQKALSLPVASRCWAQLHRIRSSYKAACVAAVKIIVCVKL